MRSFASEAIDPVTLRVISKFDINLKPLTGGSENYNTVEIFFKTSFPNAWKDLNQNPQTPRKAMVQYLKWLNALQAESLWFVATPCSFDKSWINWYLKEFCLDKMTGPIKTPFDIHDFDIRSWECGLLGADPSEADNLLYPSEWNSPLPHPHIARLDVAKASDEIIRRLQWANQRTKLYTQIL